MILFSRPAAEIILRQYSKLSMSTAAITSFYWRLFRLDLNLRIQDGAGHQVRHDARLTLDWGYTPMLFMHGYTSVGSIPSLARDLEFSPGHFLLNDYVLHQHPNTGLVLSRTPMP